MELHAEVVATSLPPENIGFDRYTRQRCHLDLFSFTNWSLIGLHVAASFSGICNSFSVVPPGNNNSEAATFMVALPELFSTDYYMLNYSLIVLGILSAPLIVFEPPNPQV